MSKKAELGIARDRAHAEQIVGELGRVGSVGDAISAPFPDRENTRNLAHKKSTKAAASAGTGGVVEGPLGLFAGIGTLAITGVGPLIAAGPIMVALSGAAVGVAVAGLAGALIGLGIPEPEAKRYEGKIKAGAQDIATTGESQVHKRSAAKPHDRASNKNVRTRALHPGRGTAKAHHRSTSRQSVQH
jgi:hypothetical protein